MEDEKRLAVVATKWREGEREEGREERGRERER